MKDANGYQQRQRLLALCRCVEGFLWLTAKLEVNLLAKLCSSIQQFGQHKVYCCAAVVVLEAPELAVQELGLLELELQVQTPMLVYLVEQVDSVDLEACQVWQQLTHDHQPKSMQLN